MTEHREKSWTVVLGRCRTRISGSELIFIVHTKDGFFCSVCCQLTVAPLKWEDRHNRGCVTCDQDGTVQYWFQGPLGIKLRSGQRHMFYYFILCFT